MTLGAIIRQRRERLGLTQDQLALLAGISKPYLSNIETGKARNPPSDGVLRELERHLSFGQDELMRMARLARTPIAVRSEHELMAAQLQQLRSVVKELLSAAPDRRMDGIDLDELARTLGEGNGARAAAGRMVPIVNEVGTGYPRRFTDLDYPGSIARDYVRCPDLDDPQAFAIRVVGDHMEPRYREGDMVIFSPSAAPHDGEDCFVRFAGAGETTFRRYCEEESGAVRLEPLNDKYDSQTYRRDQITGIWPAAIRVERLRVH